MKDGRENYFKRTSGFIIFIIITVLIALYFPCDIYSFDAPQKFSGNYLYNPYKNLSADWQKTNFHAHSVAWTGFTDGMQPAQNIINAYKQQGYNYASISNYEKVAKADMQPCAVNVYEHGWNISKTHQLVIMPQQVYYSDFPLFQSANTKQFVINKLRSSAKAVVLAHPRIKNGYADEDLKKLTGYNLMEVLNHAGDASNKWDIALSAGKPVWIIGDDDTHDILDSNKTFGNWTMIDCHYQNKDSLINNLISGNAYGVNGKNAFNDNQLINIKIDSIFVLMQLQKNADSIKLFGQNGITRKTFVNTNKADYTFLDSDTYIRAVVYNKASTMYLNPVMRYDGHKQPQNILTATINIPLTILYRCSLVICWLFLFMLLNRYTIKRIIELLQYKLRERRARFLILSSFN